MNIMKRKDRQSFRNLFAEVDPMLAAPFTVRTLDPSNVDADKKLFYSQVDLQMVAHIKDLTFSSQNIVLHTQGYWLEYINIMIWPFSLIVSADIMNNPHVDMNGKTL